ncbi:hypothetical protein F2981_28785 (plasmid) [Sinorhizobium meliloti]|nr:hypothetical protein [Sinorhizobium meliloti]
MQRTVRSYISSPSVVSTSTLISKASAMADFPVPHGHGDQVRRGGAPDPWDKANLQCRRGTSTSPTSHRHAEGAKPELGRKPEVQFKPALRLPAARRERGHCCACRQRVTGNGRTIGCRDRRRHQSVSQHGRNSPAPVAENHDVQNEPQIRRQE